MHIRLGNRIVFTSFKVSAEGFCHKSDLNMQFGCTEQKLSIIPVNIFGTGSMVDLDNECCIGCGACADLCPDVFEMDDRSRKARIIIFEVIDRAA